VLLVYFSALTLSLLGDRKGIQPIKACPTYLRGSLLEHFKEIFWWTGGDFEST